MPVRKIHSAFKPGKSTCVEAVFSVGDGEHSGASILYFANCQWGVLLDLLLNQQSKSTLPAIRSIAKYDVLIRE